MNNNNSDLLSNKTKCYCIRNLITNCFKKKIKKKSDRPKFRINLYFNKKERIP